MKKTDIQNIRKIIEIPDTQNTREIIEKPDIQNIPKIIEISIIILFVFVFVVVPILGLFLTTSQRVEKKYAPISHVCDNKANIDKDGLICISSSPINLACKCIDEQPRENDE